MKQKLIELLKTSAEADKAKALLTLELLTNHPAGIGDHSTNDFYSNAEDSLRLLAEAEDKLEMIQKHLINI